jgi:hypothetical protein
MTNFSFFIKAPPPLSFAIEALKNDPGGDLARAVPMQKRGKIAANAPR